MSFYQSMLFLPRLALTCALWSTGKSQCGLLDGKSPSLSAQANPVSLDSPWNFMRLLCLLSLPGATWPGTPQNKEEPYREALGHVTGWGWGVVSAAYQRPRQEEAKEIHEPVYLTQDGSVRLWGRGKMTPNSSPLQCNFWGLNPPRRDTVFRLTSRHCVDEL